MPQSLAKVLLHLVFSTKHRQPFLESASVRPALNAYVVGILANLDCPSLIANCVQDHIHVLFRLSRTVSIAAVVEEVKKSSSAWLKTQDVGLRNFYWQSGYAAFSVSQSSVSQVTRYIAGQEEHHRRLSFQEELRLLFRKHEVEFDERYVWD
ncbi:MAG: IS200/IS605 family transposase [Phycisphaeraceae bacterium]